MAGESEEWRWVDPRGVQSTADKWELVTLLSTGEIPYYTLVWRPGWAEWLPACRVDELEQAVGEAAEPAVQARSDPTAKLPPPPPLYKYHAYQARESEPGRKAQAIASPPVLLGSPRGPLGPPPEADELGRRPMPTLADEPAPRGGRTLRPPAAVPPPPRAMPRGPEAPDGVPKDVVIEELAPGSAPVPEADPAPELTERSSEFGSQSETGRRSRGSRSSTIERRASSSNALLFLATLLGAIAVLLGVAAVVILLRRQATLPAPTPAASEVRAVAASPSAAPAPLQQCRLARSARRVYGAADRSVPQLTLTLPDQRVAVGFAASATTAVGLSIDAGTLSTKQELLTDGKDRVFGVVPLRGEELTFAVDREGGNLRHAHTVGPALMVGMTDDGFARQRDGAVEVIWAGGGDEPTTAPRSATIQDGRHVVTFRRGGQSGSVLAGWLTPDGAQASPLSQVASEGLAGTPSVATNPTHALLTFASRPDADAKWGVALAAAPHGSVPEQSTPFVIPPGGPGVETIAPSATGLDDGRWLLQWTEGATGNRQVRVQTLGPDLTPIGDAITLSAVEDNAGQGSIHAVGGRVLALYLVIRGGEPQLWAAALQCD